MFKEHQEILITVIVGVLLVLFLVAVFILSVVRYKNRVAKDIKEKLVMKKNFENALLQSQVEVQEATLSTLSKELHDNIGQLLSTAKMLLGITEINLANPPDTLITANATVGQAINELRSLSRSLDKEWLERFLLIENLKTEINRINSANAIKLYLSHPEKLALEDDKQIILFRIIQEAIQNAIKHASAKNISISITQSHYQLKITVKDDGIGFNPEKQSDGMGIVNMKQRAKLLDGTMHYHSSNDGSSILIVMPVKQNEP